MEVEEEEEEVEVEGLGRRAGSREEVSGVAFPNCCTPERWKGAWRFGAGVRVFWVVSGCVS